MNNQMLEHIIPSYVAELALSEDKVERRIHKYIIN